MAILSEQLLGAGASAKNDWASAEAATSLTFTGEAEFRRGFEIAIGLSALANADAGLSKFIDASVRGNAFARAEASLQLQLPLNLFDEFGLSIGAQAAAEAAAGISAGLGLSIKEFVDLVRQDPKSEGLPIDLLLLLLDEATVGGAFSVYVAASAVAYASIRITGEVVKQPGFHFFVDAGLGLAAGAGFSGSLDLGIRDFRRFYGRSVDRLLVGVLDGLGPSLGAEGRTLLPQLEAMLPIASTALRLAYEIGDFLAKNQPGHGKREAADLSNHCVGVVLEEAQRFLFSRFCDAGLRSLERFVTQDVPSLGAAAWDRLRPQREALAAVLYRTPAEPFQPTAANAAHWADLIARATDLLAQLPGTSGDDLTRGMAMVFAGAELLRAAIATRVNQTQAYAFAIGAGRVTAPKPDFGGPLANDPGPRLQAHINGVVQRGPNDRLDHAVLISYLVKDGVITTLRENVPAVDTYLAIFDDPKVASGATEVLRLLLRHREAFVADAAGERNPQETLRVLLGLLERFIDGQIDAQLVPAVHRAVGDPVARTYFDEVLVASLRYVCRVAFRTVLDWEKRPIDRDAFTEALAGVMTMVLGRSLVLVADGFMTALQQDMQRACGHAAAQLDSARDPFTAIGITRSPELRGLLAETLRVGGEVFGPLPEETRRRLRAVLYDVMETLPPGEAAQASFGENLSDQFFIPNQEALDDLRDELLEISRDRFQLFAERMLQAAGAFVLEALEQLLADLQAAVRQWSEALDDTVARVQAEIAALERRIRALVREAQEAFDEARAALSRLIDTLASRALRDRLREKVADKYYRLAKAVLVDQLAYQVLPSDAKRFVRNALNELIHDIVEGPVLDPLFDAVGRVAADLDDVLDDVRELDPSEPLAPQLLDVVVDRLEDRIRDAFGGSRPKLNVGFRVDVFGVSHRFSLGTVRLPFDQLFRMLREAIDGLEILEDELEGASAQLVAAFEKSLALGGEEKRRADSEAERTRLERIQNEFTAAPKAVTIVNPAQSVVYDSHLEVEVHLGGVARSYLGLDRDEQQRVFVFLNGDAVPISTMDVGSTDGGSRASGLELPLSGALRRQPAAARGNGGSRPALRQAVRIQGGRTVAATNVVGVMAGRRMTQSKRKALVGGLPHGTTLRFRPDPARLVPGTNTLVVVVIDRGDTRYQHSVSFGVSVAPAAAPTRPGTTVSGGATLRPRLPVSAGRVPVAAPALAAMAPPSARAHTVFDRAALTARVRAAGDVMLRQSNEQMRALRASGEGGR